MTPLRSIITRAAATGTASATRRAASGGIGRAPAAATAPAATRTLHQTTAARYAPYKDDTDRTTLKPKAHENTSSGTDDDVAHDAEAFNPQNTDPDTERASANSNQAQQQQQQQEKGDKEGGEEASSSSSSLEGTPANADVASQETGAKEDRSPGGSGNHSKPSKRGKPFKKGRI